MNDLLFEVGAVATGVAFIAAAVMLVWVLIHRYQRKRRTEIERWCRDRSAMTDQEFLTACGIPQDPVQMRVAIAARNVLAEYTGVPPATIQPYDGAANFGCLFDSIDWLEVWFQIEKRADVRIKRFDQAMLVARDERFTIEHYIKAIGSMAEKEVLPR